MSNKSITIKLCKNGRLYYDGMYLKSGELLEYYKKGFDVNVRSETSFKDESTNSLNQRLLGYRCLISRFKKEAKKLSLPDVLLLGETLQKALTGRIRDEKNELDMYRKYISTSELWAKTLS